jgi:hypothetical protein
MQPWYAFIVGNDAWISRDYGDKARLATVQGYCGDVELDTYNREKARDFAAELVPSGSVYVLGEDGWPHPPLVGDADTVICAGCGHEVSSMDDIACFDNPADQTQMIVFHVNCNPPSGQE